MFMSQKNLKQIFVQFPYHFNYITTKETIFFSYINVIQFAFKSFSRWNIAKDAEKEMEKERNREENQMSLHENAVKH